MTTTPATLIFTNCPDPETAERIGRALVEDRMAACVSILPPMRSMYRWKGNVEDATESMLIIKSTTERFPAIMDRIRNMHPYELPEIIAVPVTDGLPEYLNWLQRPE